MDLLRKQSFYQMVFILLTINYYLKSLSKPFYFDINEITSRCVIRLKPGHKVDFSNVKLHEILGFEWEGNRQICDDTDSLFLNIKYHDFLIILSQTWRVVKLHSYSTLTFNLT